MLRYDLLNTLGRIAYDHPDLDDMGRPHPQHHSQAAVPDITKQNEQLGTTAGVNTAPSAFDTGGSSFLDNFGVATSMEDIGVNAGKMRDVAGSVWGAAKSVADVIPGIGKPALLTGGSLYDATGKDQPAATTTVPTAPSTVGAVYPTPTGISGDPALKAAAAAPPLVQGPAAQTFGEGYSERLESSGDLTSVSADNPSWQQFFLEVQQTWEPAGNPMVQKRIQGVIKENLAELPEASEIIVNPTFGMSLTDRNRLNEVIEKAINLDSSVMDKGKVFGIGEGDYGKNRRGSAYLTDMPSDIAQAGGSIPGLVANRVRYDATQAAEDLPEESRKRMVLHALREQGFTDDQLLSLEAFGGMVGNTVTGQPAMEAKFENMPAVVAPPPISGAADTAAGAAEAPKENMYSVFVSQAAEGISQHDVNTAQGRAALEDIATGTVFGMGPDDAFQLPPGYSIDEASGFLTAPEPETGFGILPADQEAQLREAVSLRTQARSILSNYRDPAIAEKRAERIMGAELTEEGYQLQRDLQAEEGQLQIDLQTSGNEWQKAQNEEARQLQKDLQSSEIQADKDLQASNATLQKDLQITANRHQKQMQGLDNTHEMNIASMDDTLQRDLAAASNVIASQRLNYEAAWNEGQVGRATQIADNQYQNDMKLIFRRASAEQDTLQKSYELDEQFGRDPRMLIMTEGTQQRLAIGQQGAQDIKLAGARGVQERMGIAAAGAQERLNISDKGSQDRLSIAARGAIDQSLESMRQGGQTNRLGMQIQADELAQGRQITHEEAMQKAELQLKTLLQNAQLSHAVSQLDTQGQQALAQLGARGELDTLAQARDIQSREFMAGNQITHESALAQARQVHEAATQAAGITGAGVQERATLREQQDIAREERAELGISTGADAVTMARESTGAYITDLNTAMQNAVAGDYSNVDAALSAELPPVPSGVVWSSQTGVFQQRGGFEGREIDTETQQWIAAATPAFKARDRAEQALTQARTLQLESDLRIRERRMADDDFRQAMLTADIDTAEEAITRQRMAETQQLEVETKMQNMQMLLGLLQNPVQLGMAKRHGLLGQIETALGFQIGNVPTAPASGQGIPTPEEWQSLDSETQAFRIAAYVEQGGSPDEFMQMIAAGSPGQMQQIQYGVL